MQVQTPSSFVATINSPTAPVLQRFLADKDCPVAWQAALHPGPGWPAAGTGFWLHGIPFQAGAVARLNGLSELERTTLKHALEQFKDGALGEIEKAYPHASGQLAVAKIVFATADVFASGPASRVRSFTPVALEVGKDLLALAAPLAPKTIAPYLKVISVVAQLGEQLVQYCQEHPAALTKT